MRRSIGAAVLVMSVVAFGCGGGDDDGTGPENASVTQAEAVAVSQNLFVEVSRAMATATYSGNTASGKSALIMPSFSFNGNCTSGGTVSGNGTYSTGSSSTSYDLTYTPNNCKVNGGTRFFTVNGDPNIHMTWNLTQGNSALNYAVKGGLKWDGGSCKMDYSLNSNASTGHGSIKGSICGISIDQSY